MASSSTILMALIAVAVVGGGVYYLSTQSKSPPLSHTPGNFPVGTIQGVATPVMAWSGSPYVPAVPAGMGPPAYPAIPATMGPPPASTPVWLDLPPGGPVTAEEAASVERVLATLEDRLPLTLPTRVVASPYNTKAGSGIQSDLRWAVYVALELTYRDPTRAWVATGHAPAPVTIDFDRGFWGPIVAERIQRYYLRRAAELDARRGRDIPPPGNTVTDDEKASVTSVAPYVRDGRWPVLSPMIVPEPYNTHPEGMSPVDWSARVATYLTYRSPAREWVQTGHQPAPLDLSAAPWAAVLARIHTHLVAVTQETA